MAPLHFSVLGPLEVRRGDRRVDVGGAKQRTLLAALLLTPNQVVSADRLVELLWADDATERSRATLHVNVAKLRRALTGPTGEPPPLETIRPGYRVVVTPSLLDRLAFDEIVTAARAARARGDDDEAADRFREALALPRGELLADLADEGFVREEARIFERTLVAVTADAFECELERGHHAQVVGALERAVIDNPLDERLAELLVLAHYRCGRQSDALAAGRRLRTTLREEMGVDVGPSFEALERQVLDHDAGLLTAGPARAEVDMATSTVVRPSRSMTSAVLVMGQQRLDLLRSITTIGRRPDRTIVVDDQDVSRTHAEIRRVGDKFVLVDVGSTNGTLVNDARVVEHELQSGDEIRVGTTTLRFEA